MKIGKFTSRASFMLAVVAVSTMALSGCEQTKRILGQSKQAPDEFTVYSRAPLSMPPDYTLRPPTPGSERPQAVNPRDRARQAILTSSGRPLPSSQDGVESKGASRGEIAILNRTGALNANSEIRGVVDRESAFLAEESKTFTDRIIFWGVPTTSGTAVDAVAEAKRIREAQAMGQPLNKGTIPVIKRRQKGLLEDLVK